MAYHYLTSIQNTLPLSCHIFYLYASKMFGESALWCLTEYTLVQVDSEWFTFTTICINVEEISWQMRNMKVELHIMGNEFKSW